MNGGEGGRRPLVLALGGGGARGAAHLGVLEVLEQEGLRADAIAGTSAGAIVAAAYAGGWSPREILAHARDLSWRRLAGISRHPLGSGLLQPDGLRRLLREDLGLHRFAHLRSPLALVATDLRAGSAVILDRDSASLDLTDAILASCAVPGCFPPVLHGSRYLVDGGLVENLPVRAARELASTHALGQETVVVSVDLMAYTASGRPPVGILESWQRSLWLMLSARPGQDLGDVSLCPAIGEFSFTDLSVLDDLFEQGVRAAQASLPALREATRSTS